MVWATEKTATLIVNKFRYMIQLLMLYIVNDVEKLCKWWSGQVLDGGDCGLFQGTVLAFA
jgi:hypothetical protein